MNAHMVDMYSSNVHWEGEMAYSRSQSNAMHAHKYSLYTTSYKGITSILLKPSVELNTKNIIVIQLNCDYHI